MLLMEWNIKMSAKAARRSTAASEKIPEKIRGFDQEAWRGCAAKKTET
jgi:hypothetical protein